MPNVHHPEVMRGILERVLSTGDALGLEDMEAEPDGEDDVGV